jgi:hypothetical protein
MYRKYCPNPVKEDLCLRLFNTHFNEYFYKPRNDRYDLCRQHRFITHSPEDEKKNQMMRRLEEVGIKLKERV